MWILYYWYCCGGCYVSEVLGIEWVLSRFAVRLGWSLGRRVNRACAPFFSLIIAHRLPCLLLLISYSSFLTTTTATRPSALLSLSLSTVITLRSRCTHNSSTVNSAGTGFPIPLTFDVRNQAKVETFAAPIDTDDTDAHFVSSITILFDLCSASLLRISNLHDTCKDACQRLVSVPLTYLFLSHLRSILFCVERAFSYINDGNPLRRYSYLDFKTYSARVRLERPDGLYDVLSAFCAIVMLDACVWTHWCVSMSSFIYIASFDGYV